MRVLVLVKATEETERGAMPNKEMMDKMGEFNERLIKAGVMLAADGLHPTSKGKRVRFDGEQRKVIDGPFAETKELLAGFWMWNVNSMEEAVDWLKQAPFDGGAEVEIRPIFAPEDFAPEVRERRKRFYEKMAAEG